MADQEQFTAEQAQKLLEEVYSKPGVAPSTTAVVEQTKTPEAATPAPPAETDKKTEETKEPVKDTQQANKPAEEKKPEEQAPADPYAWINDIPEALRSKVTQEINQRMAVEHRNRSDSGRIRALNAKLLELERRSAPAAKEPVQASPQPTKTPEVWTKLAKDDPEIAEAVEARVKSEVEAAKEHIGSELQELKKTEAQRAAFEQQQYVESEFAQLQRLIPNVAVVVQSPQYKDWLENYAPPGIRELALTSLDHRDAYNVMKVYSDDMQRLLGVAPPQQQEQKSPDAKQPVADTTEADKIAAARKAKLEASPAAPSKIPVAPADPSGPVTKEEAERLFAEYSKSLYTKRT